MMTYAEKVLCTKCSSCGGCTRVEECVSKIEYGHTYNCRLYKPLSERIKKIEKSQEEEIRRWLFKASNECSVIYSKTVKEKTNDQTRQSTKTT